MTDGASRFAARFPVVWHVMEADGADACRVLYPASDLARIAGRDENNANREDFLAVDLPQGGQAVIRPQFMRDAALRPTLGGAFAEQPALWRAHINRHVFFWVTADRRDRFIAAVARARARSSAAPSAAAPVTFAVPTAKLLDAYGTHASFSTVNTGSTLRGGGRIRRDETTLQSVSRFRGGPVAELAIRAPVDLRTAGFAATWREA